MTLAFEDRSLEEAFREAYRDVVRRAGRMALLAGLILYALFGLLDLLLIPTQAEPLWIIRYGIVCPYFAAAYLVCDTKWGRLRPEALLISAILIAGLGVTSIVVLADPPAGFAQYAGPVLIILYGYTVTRLRFLQATITCWVVTGIYAAAVGLIDPLPYPILIRQGLFLVAAHVLGMVACYQLEYHSRQEFYLAQELKAAAARDPLTGLLNRRILDSELDRLMAHFHRHHIPFSLLMLDLNQFKAINDTWGHMAGDAVLREVGRFLQAHMRDEDHVIRFGGDEFLIIAPATHEREALALATRLQEELDHLVIPELPEAPRIQFSVGVIEMTAGIKSPQDLLNGASISLQQAKNQTPVTGTSRSP